jgi:HlyD family secretion protein
MKEKKKLSWWIIPVVLAAMVVAGLAGQAGLSAQAAGSTPPAATATATALPAAAQASDILAVGTLRTGQNVSLAWQTSGTVAQVLVKKGDSVQKGQLLAQLDPASNIAFAAAQANLLAAQQSLANLQNVAVAQATAKQALVNAQNTVASDRQALAALNTPPSAAAIAGWTAFYLADQAQVTNAQTNYDYWVAYANLPHCPVITKGSPPPTYKCRTLNDTDLAIQQANAKSALSSATAKEQNDLAYLTYLQNYQPDPGLLSQAQTKLAIAQQQLVIAQANEDAAQKSPTPAQLAAAQANIASIQATLDQQNLKAPFAGVITGLGVKAGDLVTGGTYALRIDNMTPLYIDLQVSEIDINKIKVGQSMQLQFTGVPNKQYAATVTTISPIGVVSGGVANFTVTAQLTAADASIKPGMTAEAIIGVQQ